ncbi:Inner membrane protein YbaN [Corynebacterium atrinae]|uniref:YbaN family protein n=1 Tax=Corynebacterium atrinae TaxID=1336740 RepID=UPI0025B448ED|nr:YbaN family protein [Corynebacterium atrinae]WJY64637.1 Inner membrane protein YbaN [Corynebacterium atrinae]
MLKPLFIAIGCLSLALGTVGIVLPLLPTTPFLLLSAFCFARGSDRLHSYLLNHRIFGRYISNYYQHAMSPRDKVRTLMLLWIGIGLSVWLMGMFWPGVMTVFIATGVTVHILRLSPQPEKAIASAS